jgi:hypothetical protein
MRHERRGREDEGARVRRRWIRCSHGVGGLDHVDFSRSVVLFAMKLSASDRRATTGMMSLPCQCCLLLVFFSSSRLYVGIVFVFGRVHRLGAEAWPCTRSFLDSVPH